MEAKTAKSSDCVDIKLSEKKQSQPATANKTPASLPSFCKETSSSVVLAQDKVPTQLCVTPISSETTCPTTLGRTKPINSSTPKDLFSSSKLKKSLPVHPKTQLGAQDASASQSTRSTTHQGRRPKGNLQKVTFSCNVDTKSAHKVRHSFQSDDKGGDNHERKDDKNHDHNNDKVDDLNNDESHHDDKYLDHQTELKKTNKGNSTKDNRAVAKTQSGKEECSERICIDLKKHKIDLLNEKSREKIGETQEHHGVQERGSVNVKVKETRKVQLKLNTAIADKDKVDEPTSKKEGSVNETEISEESKEDQHKDMQKDKIENPKNVQRKISSVKTEKEQFNITSKKGEKENEDKKYSDNEESFFEDACEMFVADAEPENEACRLIISSQKVENITKEYVSSITHKEENKHFSPGVCQEDISKRYQCTSVTEEANLLSKDTQTIISENLQKSAQSENVLRQGSTALTRTCDTIVKSNEGHPSGVNKIAMAISSTWNFAKNIVTTPWNRKREHVDGSEEEEEEEEVSDVPPKKMKLTSGSPTAKALQVQYKSQKSRNVLYNIKGRAPLSRMKGSSVNDK